MQPDTMHPYLCGRDAAWQHDDQKFFFRLNSLHVQWDVPRRLGSLVPVQ